MRAKPSRAFAPGRVTHGGQVEGGGFWQSATQEEDLNAGTDRGWWLASEWCTTTTEKAEESFSRERLPIVMETMPLALGLSIKDCVVAFSAVQSLHVKNTSQPSINLEGHIVYTPLCNKICGHRSGFFGISRPKLKIHQEDNHTKLRVIIDDDTLPVCEMGSSKESKHSEQRYLFLSHT